MALNETTLVQRTTADYLRDALGWRNDSPATPKSPAGGQADDVDCCEALPASTGRTGTTSDELKIQPP